MENYVRCIYLNELSSDDESIGMGIAKLFVETPKKTAPLAQKLVNKARQELTDQHLRLKVLAFIQSFVVYKFPNLTQKEIEAMLNLSDDIEKNWLFSKCLEKK